MIVTCENCSSRFVVDPKVLLPNGRRVRCARCKHVWFQAPPSASDLAARAAFQNTPTTPQPAQTNAPSAQDTDVERRQIFTRTPEDPAQDEGPSPEATAQDDAEDAADAPDDVFGDADTAAAQDEASQATDPEDADLDALLNDDLGNAGSSGDDVTELPWDRPSRRKKKSQVPALYKERSPLVAAAGWMAILALVLSAIGTAIFARETIAAKVPATKSVYAAIGLDIKPKLITENAGDYLNIETPPQTPAYWRDDQLIQEITGSILNTADAPVQVPTLEGILRDADKKELYRWLFSADVDILAPGQKASFATEIIGLPQNAAEMELVFAQGQPLKPVAGSKADQSSAVERSR